MEDFEQIVFEKQLVFELDNELNDDAIVGYHSNKQIKIQMKLNKLNFTRNLLLVNPYIIGLIAVFDTVKK